MGTFAGVGFSLDKNPADAGKEAALQAMQRGRMAKPDFLFVFATVGYDQELLLRSVRDATAGAPLSGCSGEGVITAGAAAETNFGVCVLAIASDEVRFANAYVQGLDAGYARAGELLGEQVRPLLDDDAVACFLFADGLLFDFDPFRDAFETALGCGRALPMFGGLAANNLSTRRTYQYHDDQVISEGICCVVMSGNARLAWGVNHGCVPVGTRRTITRCQGNIIYEIDGIPALEALKEYIENGSGSDWNKVTLNLCLGFKTPEHLRKEYGEYIIRYMMDKNDQEGWVSIQSDVTQGSALWIMRRDKELMREGLQTISRHIREQLGESRPKLVMQFECMGRGRVVYREQEKLELLKSLQDDLGAELPWIGFYSYAEIGPVSGYNCIHNFTSVLLAVY
uniref:Histidine kinase n=1 Tax=Geobacter sp. (strain M21) TaxID=443144 RepID=C6E9P6_GEOSM